MKYYFKTGEEVCHRDHPETKMYVDRILKRTIDQTDGSKKSFTLGIECHWLDKEMKYQAGKFLTMELLPYKNGAPVKEREKEMLERV